MSSTGCPKNVKIINELLKHLIRNKNNLTCKGKGELQSHPPDRHQRAEPYPFGFLLPVDKLPLSTFDKIYSTSFLTTGEMCCVQRTLATVSPIGQGRWGDRVAKTPFLSPFSLGTLTWTQNTPKNLQTANISQKKKKKPYTFAFSLDWDGFLQSFSISVLRWKT